MIKQHPLILLTPVLPEKLDSLNERLNRIKKALQAGSETEFPKVSTVHYCRWVILDRDSFRDEPAIPVSTRLIFSSNFDGDENNHLEELVTNLTGYIDEVYECCEGYPEPAARTTESRKNYLKKWAVKTTAFYIGAPWRSVQQIKDEDKLRDYIWHYIMNNKWDGQSAIEVHRAIRKEINNKSEFDWSKQPAEVKKENWFIFTVYILLGLPLLPFMLLFILYIHFFHERRDKNGQLLLSEIPDHKVRRLEEDEDLFPQNQFTQVAVMKPGFARKLNYKIWMLRTRILAGHIFVRGKLLNIPTIHFARWVSIDDDKHVLFFSNFDGSWQQYLGDFIDQSGWGLSGIFSNTVNFPKTHFMGLLGIVPGMPLKFPGTNFVLTGGAYDEEHFLAWSRSTQIPTQVWYSAYHHLSIKNILNNTEIRNDLYKDLNEKQAQQFLKRF
jgi:hypothetical protein